MKVRAVNKATIENKNKTPPHSLGVFHRAFQQVKNLPFLSIQTQNTYSFHPLLKKP